MKQLTIAVLLVLNFSAANFSKEKKIIGEWKIIKTLSREKVSDHIYSEKASGLIGNELRIDFSEDHTAIAWDSERKISDKLTWEMSGSKIKMAYAGKNSMLTPLNGELEINSLNKHEMELFNKTQNISVFFERKE